MPWTALTSDIDDAVRIKVSRQLSWVLRRGARQTGLHPDRDGWVQVADLLQCKYFESYSEGQLLRVIHSSNKEKVRYELRRSAKSSGKEVRATDRRQEEVLDGERKAPGAARRRAEQPPEPSLCSTVSGDGGATSSNRSECSSGCDAPAVAGDAADAPSRPEASLPTAASTPPAASSARTPPSASCADSADASTLCPRSAPWSTSWGSPWLPPPAGTSLCRPASSSSWPTVRQVAEWWQESAALSQASQEAYCGMYAQRAAAVAAAQSHARHLSRVMQSSPEAAKAPPLPPSWRGDRAEAPAAGRRAAPVRSSQMAAAPRARGLEVGRPALTMDCAALSSSFAEASDDELLGLARKTLLASGFEEKDILSAKLDEKRRFCILEVSLTL